MRLPRRACQPGTTGERLRSLGSVGQVPCSHWSTMSGLASIHFFAAASGSILSLAMYSATLFWSSLVHWKFLTSVYAGEPESANFFETSLFSWYGG